MLHHTRRDVEMATHNNTAEMLWFRDRRLSCANLAHQELGSVSAVSLSVVYIVYVLTYSHTLYVYFYVHLRTLFIYITIVIMIVSRGGAQTCNAAGPQAITNGEGDIILSTDVQDLIPVGVCKVLLVLQEAQLHHIQRSEQIRQQNPSCVTRGTAAAHPQK